MLYQNREVVFLKEDHVKSKKQRIQHGKELRGTLMGLRKGSRVMSVKGRGRTGAWRPVSGLSEGKFKNDS